MQNNVQVRANFYKQFIKVGVTIKNVPCSFFMPDTTRIFHFLYNYSLGFAIMNLLYTYNFCGWSL